MPVITFTSDYGLVDHRVPAVKGKILSLNENARIIDISHEIQAYNLLQTAYIVRNAYPFFPEGTVHIISVDSFYTKERKCILYKADGHYFIAADNGVLSLIYYFLVCQFIVFGLYYYRRFYTISKMIKQPNTFSSRESIIKLYYEFHFAIETYRSSIYILLPTSIALFTIMSDKEKTTEIINKFYHFNETLQTDPTFIYSILIIGVISIVLLILLSEWLIKRFYGRYLKQLKELMDEFED